MSVNTQFTVGKNVFEIRRTGRLMLNCNDIESMPRNLWPMKVTESREEMGLKGTLKKWEKFMLDGWSDHSGRYYTFERFEHGDDCRWSVMQHQPM